MAYAGTRSSIAHAIVGAAVEVDPSEGDEAVSRGLGNARQPRASPSGRRRGKTLGCLASSSRMAGALKVQHTTSSIAHVACDRVSAS